MQTIVRKIEPNKEIQRTQRQRQRQRQRQTKNERDLESKKKVITEGEDHNERTRVEEAQMIGQMIGQIKGQTRSLRRFLFGIR